MAILRPTNERVCNVPIAQGEVEPRFDHFADMVTNDELDRQAGMTIQQLRQARCQTEPAP